MKIKLVIVYENGRLGNQLFQYSAIQRAAPDALLLNLGMQSLLHLLCTVRVVEETVWRKIVLRALIRIGRVRMQRLAGRGRLFTLITEKRLEHRCIIDIQPGLIPWIALSDGFFQDETIVRSIDSRPLSVEKLLICRAKDWIESQTNLPSAHHYFVHVRRGDYVYWPSRDAPAVLSASWYVAQMRWILSQDDKAQFFVFSNDLPYVEEMLCGICNVFVSKGSELEDLAAMSLCHGGGVLSASTFAWWGAFYARQNNLEAIFLAPEFWAGWRQKRWLPPSLQSDWIRYVQAF